MLGVRAPTWLRPWRPGAAISDLFPWRSDGQWQTRFDLMNLSALLFPDRPARENVWVVFFDTAGRIIRQERFRIEPFEKKELVVGDFVSGELGGFSCFHLDDCGDTVQCGGGHMVERNYLAFRRAQDQSPIWAYVHGNTYAFSCDGHDAPLRSIAGRPRAPLVYRPQMCFDDCDAFDLVFSNTSTRAVEAEVRLLDKVRETVRTERVRLAPRGLARIGIDNGDRCITMVENYGAHFMWRPMVFKFYETGFDVLHS
jgi:hypothetical protein